MAVRTAPTKWKSPRSPSPKKPKRTNSDVSFAGPLDVADARLALFAASLAQREGTTLRVHFGMDDGSAIEAIAVDLGWLGIAWDREAADNSARVDRYSEYAQQLTAAGLTHMVAGAMHLRPRAGRTLLADELRGAVAVDNASLGPIVVVAADGVADPAFGAALDLARSASPCVVREERQLEYSAREQFTLAALGLPPPRYAHLGNLQAADADSDLPSIAALRRAGFLPAAVSEFFRRLDAGPVAFDARALRACNARVLRALPAPQLAVALSGSMQRVGLLEEPIPSAAQRWIDTFLIAYSDAFETLGEALAIVRDLRAEAVLVPALELEALRNRQVIFYLDAVGQYVDAQAELRDLPLEHDLAAIAGEFGIAPADAFRAVRTTLTGKRDGPPLALIFPLLGHDRILIRIGAISSHLLHGRGLEPIKFGPGGVPFATIVPNGPPET